MTETQVRLQEAVRLGYLVLDVGRPVSWQGYGGATSRDGSLSRAWYRWCEQEQRPHARIFRCVAKGVSAVEVDFDSPRPAGGWGTRWETYERAANDAAATAERVLREVLPWVRTVEEMNATLPPRRVRYTPEEQTATAWSCGRGTWRMNSCPLQDDTRLVERWLVAAQHYPRPTA